jgi:hypothetical protein
MKSSRSVKSLLLCIVLSGIFVPQKIYAMDFDGKCKWLLGGLVGGAMACLGLQYVWQKIRPQTPQTPEQRLELPKNAAIFYTVPSEYEGGRDYLLDTTNNIRYSYYSAIKIDRKGSEFALYPDNDELSFDIDANAVYKKNKTVGKALLWKHSQSL